MNGGYIAVNILAAILIITSLMVLLAKSPRRTAYIYGAQAIDLVVLLVVMGFTTGYPELFEWAGTSVLTKVLFVPITVLVTIHYMKKAGMKEETEEAHSTIRPWLSVIFVIGEVILCFFAIDGITIPTAEEVKPTLAISLAHFFIGLTCIISQRNILKQVFGYCLMENGSHITMAVLSPGAPSLVEVGVSTDAIFGTIILCVLAYRIYRKNHSIDANDLMDLKG